MYELFYRTEVNVICLFLLAWVTYHLVASQDQQTKNIIFKRVMISSVLISPTCFCPLSDIKSNSCFRDNPIFNRWTYRKMVLYIELFPFVYISDF